jgi:hypothetical protein
MQRDFRSPVGKSEKKFPQEPARTCTFSGAKMAKRPGFPEKMDLQTPLQKCAE